MNILGISAYYHDSAACLVRDGQIIAAAQEERFTRRKHDFSFPRHAIRYCLQEGRIDGQQLDLVAFYDKPFLKFERLLQTYFAYAPRGLQSFLLAMPLWLKQKIWMKDLLADELDFSGKILFPEHHQSHAASAFFPSPFPKAAILTIDGVGEWTTTSCGAGDGNHLHLLKEIHFPHSLGLLYSAFTYFTGFKVNSGEYKLMGLAPYGEPKYVQRIYEHLIDLKEDGSFRLNMAYFNYGAGLTMTNAKFAALFDGPPRKPETEITRREMDLARSIQAVTEEIMLRLAGFAHKQTGLRHLVLAGGVALNCVGNGRILREGPFEDIWIQPAAGDAGGALGAALYTWHHYLGQLRQTDGKTDFQKGSYLGPAYTHAEIEEVLKTAGATFKKLSDGEVAETTAGLLAQGKVVGWFQGRMEFGPRALGNRSILGDARSPEMQRRLNLKIKFRESFRPFAPAVLRECVSDYFELDRPSPYMLITAPVSTVRRRAGAGEQWRGLDKLKAVRSDIPAVTHVDYSARVQSVDRDNNPRFHALLSAFRQKTGCSVLINTSFNVRGEPIVCTPREAFDCFMRTGMDYLVLGNHLLKKEEQAAAPRLSAQPVSYKLD